MDGENNGKPYEKWMIGGGVTYFWKHPNLELQNVIQRKKILLTLEDSG